MGAVLSCPRCRWGASGRQWTKEGPVCSRSGSYVLQGVSLRVDKSQVVGILGRNGMGKTTLMRPIIGFVPPRTGQVLFKGQDITGCPTGPCVSEWRWCPKDG